MTSLREQTVSGTFWSAVDAFLGQGITFIVGIVLARLLSPDEYGLIGILSIFIVVFNSIVDGGLSNALIRKKEITTADCNTLFYTNLLISLLLSSLLFFSAPIIARFFDESTLILLSEAMSSIIVINALSIVQNVILTKKIDFKTKAKASLFSSIISGFIGITMAYLDLGVWSLVGQQISRQLLNTILLWFLNRWTPSFIFSVTSFKEMFTFGWKIMTTTVISQTWNNLSQVVIGKCYNAFELGQYTRAQQFSSIFSVNLTTIIQRVSYPALSQIQDEDLRLKEAYRKVVKCSLFVTFLSMFSLAAIAKPLIFALIGTQWEPCIEYLRIICIFMALYPLHAINLNMLQIKGRSDLFLKLEIIKKIIAIIPLLFGLFISIKTMLFATIFTEIIAYLLNAGCSGPLINYPIREQLKDIFPSIASSTIIAVSLFFVSTININYWILLFILFIVWMVMSHFIFRIFKIKEYQEVKNIIKTFVNKISQ